MEVIKILSYEKSISLFARTGIMTALVLQGTVSKAQPAPVAEPVFTETIRPFKIYAAQKDLDDLRQRIKATRWPDHEIASNKSQGAPFENLQGLAHYWATVNNWRKPE